MTEQFAVHAAAAPATRESLAGDLRAAGLRTGGVVLVHASLRSLGWVCGGPVAVVQALTDVVGPEGTIAMPSHSGDYSEPSHWENPPVPASWWPTIREQMPAFDPRVTPTRRMGAIAEVFRTWPGTLRSGHPASSFAAWGRHARDVTDGRALDHALGEGSPLARLYDLDAAILLLGVDHEANTSLHLAEERWGRLASRTQGAPVLDAGVRVWRTYSDPDYDASDFPAIGNAYAAARHCTPVRIAEASSHFVSQRDLVDFGVQWMKEHRERS